MSSRFHLLFLSETISYINYAIQKLSCSFCAFKETYRNERYASIYLKTCAAKLNNGKANSKVAQNLELFCTGDPHGWTIVPVHLVQQQPLQACSILDDDFAQFLPLSKGPV